MVNLKYDCVLPSAYYIQFSCRHLFVKQWATPGIFFLYFFFSVVISKCMRCEISPKTGFERQTAGFGSDHSANCATTTDGPRGQLSNVYFFCSKIAVSSPSCHRTFKVFLLFTDSQVPNQQKFCSVSISMI